MDGVATRELAPECILLAAVTHFCCWNGVCLSLSCCTTIAMQQILLTMFCVGEDEGRDLFLPFLLALRQCRAGRFK